MRRRLGSAMDTRTGTLERNLGEWVLGTARAFDDDVALRIRRGDRVLSLSYAQVGAYARKVAAWLAAQGLRPGDRVAVWAPNMPEYAVLYFGSWLAGMVVVPIDVRTRQDVVQRFVTTAAPRLGFTSEQIEGRFGSPVARTFALEDLLTLVEPATATASFPEVGHDSLCEIAFTSGTTGVPKGVLLTHGNLLAALNAMRLAFPLKRSYRTLSVLPLSHALEQVINLLLAFNFGVRQTYVARPSPESLTRAMRDDQITCFIAVPELLRIMLAGIERQVRRQGAWRRWQLAHRVAGRLPFALRRLLFRQVHRALGAHLLFLGSGGAPLDLKLASAWERMGIHILEGYGLTETTGPASINNWVNKRLGTAGKPLPGVDIRIGDDGEVQIRGMTVTSGYLDNAELTARSFSDGWFRTGDIGFFDADGFLHISGRDVFKIVLADGHKVYPEDVEQMLNRHPLVRESCVVGVEGEHGVVVHAAVLTDQPDRAYEAIRDTNRLLAPHQQVKGFTVWQEADFPRTPMLKVDRKQVRLAVEAR